MHVVIAQLLGDQSDAPHFRKLHAGILPRAHEESSHRGNKHSYGRLFDQTLIDQALDHARIGEGRDIAKLTSLIFSDLA